MKHRTVSREDILERLKAEREAYTVSIYAAHKEVRRLMERVEVLNWQIQQLGRGIRDSPTQEKT